MVLDEAAIDRAMTNARRKWKDTGDPVWAFAEAAFRFTLGDTIIDPTILATFTRDPKDHG